MTTIPLSDAIFKFQSHTYARDKLFRIVQYASRFAVWSLSNQLSGGQLVEKLQKLEAAVGLSRKLFRMGNTFEMAQKALAALSIQGHVLRTAAFTANSLKSLWLFLDHGIWLGKVGMISINLPEWNRKAAWAWLIGITASAIFNFLKLMHQQTKLDSLLLQMETVGRHDLADEVKVEMHTLRLALWRDVCDLFIPLSSLQFVNPGLGAFCGVISSVIGFQMEWEKHITPFKAR